MARIEKLKKKLAVIFGLHERPVSSFLRKLTGHVFVDVGSNYGYYPMLLHKNFDKIIAFEPVPSIFQELEDNLGKYNNVVRIRKAVSNVDGNLLNIAYRGSQGYAETITLASSFPNMEIDLVKVDAEGREWDVLKGAEPITNKIRSWVVELHDPERKKELENWFTSRGYLTSWLDFAYRGSKTANHIYAWRKEVKLETDK